MTAQALAAVEDAPSAIQTTHDAYAALPGVNWSTLKEMTRSALHYHSRLDTPREDTPGMAMGRAIHTAVLEPDRFPLEYVVFDGPRRAGNEWQAFAAANAGRTILKRDEYQTCLNVRDAVRAHKPAARLLRRGKAEMTLRWTDPITRIRCKARLDHVHAGAITDLKSTQDVDARTFGRLAERMGYHLQLAFYRMGMDALGMRPGPVRIIAVEATAPHDVAVYTLAEDDLLASMDVVQGLLQRVKECRRKRRWPGRYVGEQPLDLPPWTFPSEEEIGDLGITFGA